ncbi:MAG: ATP-binding protein [Oscillospiraceae bacterium]|nr:ATP-binding protein [Oscillospiraceae bacterium]
MDSVEQLQEELKKLKKENRILQRELYEAQKNVTIIESNLSFQKNIYNMVKKQKEQQDLYFRLVFEYTPDTILIIDRNHQLIDATRSAFETFEIEFEDNFSLEKIAKSNQTAFDFFAPYLPIEQLQYAYAVVIEAMERGDTYTQNELILTINGENRVFKADVISLKNPEKEIIGVMINLHEVSDLHEALETAERASQAKSNFLAKVSHEIRTPMNAILGMSELALREELSKEVFEHVSEIKKAGDHLVSLINDILDFSKIESGMMEINPFNYSLQSLLNYAIGITRTKIVELPILFVADVCPTIPDTLIGDEIRIRQMLLNLLSNACKYNERGFVKLVVSNERIDNTTIMLYFEVHDSGIGIKPENLDKLFGDFVQLGESVGKRDVGGTGLGLAITRGFTEAMNGKIEVESEYGKGSIFKIAIPQIVDLSQIVKPFACIDDICQTTSVLLYETRELFVKSLTLSLERLGIEYILVSDQIEFTKILEKRQEAGGIFDFIFISSFVFDTTEKLIRSLKWDKMLIVLIAEYGEIAVENDAVKTLFMPAHTANIAALFNNKTEEESGNRRQGAKFIAPNARALVVDDINTNLIVAQGLLSAYQLQIDTVNSGQEAIDAVQVKEYDIVFMDHMMPEMNGIEAVAHIRGFATDDSELNYFRKLPIISLTANAVSGVREMFLKNGFHDFLAKPIDINLLENILEKWLPQEKLEDQITFMGSGADAEQIAESEIALKVLRIKGVDVESGVYMTGGEISNYLNTLTIFKNDGDRAINVIRECAKDEDFSLLGTHVHAMKSASASIGAVRVSNMAKNLENAAKNNDGDFISQNVEKFLEELSMLLEGINVSLTALRVARTSRRQLSGIKAKINPTVVIEQAKRLKIAIDAFDMEEIDATIDVLKKQVGTDNELETLVEEIAGNVLICEFEKVETLADELVKSVKS